MSTPDSKLLPVDLGGYLEKGTQWYSKCLGWRSHSDQAPPIDVNQFGEWTKNMISQDLPHRLWDISLIEILPLSPNKATPGTVAFIGFKQKVTNHHISWEFKVPPPKATPPPRNKALFGDY